jgi:hypothetical protein
VVFCIAIVVCSLLAVTFFLQPSNSPPSNSQSPNLPGLQDAVTKAINYFDGSSEPYALLMLNVMYRRFDIAAFSDSLQRYDQVLAGNPGNAPLLRVFRRIAYHDNQLQANDLQSVTVNIDQITVPALYCDQLKLSSDYSETLEWAEESGGYLLTHVLLACIWIQDNGCEVPMPSGFLQDVYHETAALINGDQVVTDLELEAASFLYLAGQGALVPTAFVSQVIAVQNSDGGWRASSDAQGASDWHSSVSGLMVLLHVEYPSDSYPPMLAPA